MKKPAFSDLARNSAALLLIASLPLLSACSTSDTQKNLTVAQLDCNPKFTFCAEPNEQPAEPMQPPAWQPVFFEFDSAITEAPDLRPYADYLQEHPDVQIVLHGYSDSLGSVKHNLQLSEDRAVFIKATLMAEGIAANRIQIRAHGNQHANQRNIIKISGTSLKEQVQHLATELGVELEYLIPASTGGSQ